MMGNTQWELVIERILGVAVEQVFYHNSNIVSITNRIVISFELFPTNCGVLD